MKVEYNGSQVHAEMNEAHIGEYSIRNDSAFNRFLLEHDYVGTGCGIASFVTAIFSLMAGVIFQYGTVFLHSVIGEMADYYTLTAAILCAIMITVSIATGVLAIIACAKIKKFIGKFGIAMAISGLSMSLIAIFLDILLILL